MPEEQNLRLPGNVPDSASNIAADASRSQIAEVIRAKRDRREFSLSPEALAAKEAALLADIESFDFAAAQAAAIRAHQNGLTGGGWAPEQAAEEKTRNYPNIVPDGVVRPIKRTDATKENIKNEDFSSLPHFSGGLLKQLRQQVGILTGQQEAEWQHLAEVESELGLTLYQTFSYLHDLTLQLNILKPAIPREYLITDGCELKNLVWQRGLVDYRTLPKSAGNTVESVSFSYRLASETPLVIEREGPLADAFRQRHFEFNLKDVTEEFRSASRYLERVRFTITPEIRV
ncbi:MAG: hypothetical protein LBS89_07715, partial [Zoogloeaceae bacterium]|nr:hypothetical protein [Zoogloeaceae bacterium]